MTPAQQLMVDDGLPVALILSTVERLEAWKGVEMPTAGPKEQQRAQLRIERAQKAESSAKQQEQETTMTTKKTPKKKIAKIAKKAAAKKAGPAARKPATSVQRANRAGKAASQSNARTPSAGVRAGSKLEIIVALLTRPGGCTAKECMEACNWPAISMPQQAKAAGLTLKKEKRDGVNYYSA